MKKINLGTNWNGTQTIIHVDDDELISQDIQDVQPILDNVQRMSPKKGGNGRIVGQIPITLYTTWRKEHREKFAQDMSWREYYAWRLRNSDYKKLLTEKV